MNGERTAHGARSGDATHHALAVRLLLAVALILPLPVLAQGVLVLQTDFGLRDHAVAAMRGVAIGVDPTLSIHDLTHEIPAFDIAQASFRLAAVAPYWPAGTVFVSVVDPGVGTQRRSVVAELAGSRYVVTPDNGTLTDLAARGEIVAVRRLDEAVHRLPGSEQSHTFHGRDVYAQTGARLASGALAFAQVGARLTGPVILARPPVRRDGEWIRGHIPVLDPQYGNVWTDIPADMLGAAVGTQLDVRICQGERIRHSARMPFAATFGDVPAGAALLYANSVGNLAIALNQSDFAGRYGIEAGPEWMVLIRPAGGGSTAPCAPGSPAD